MPPVRHMCSCHWMTYSNALNSNIIKCFINLTWVAVEYCLWQVSQYHRLYCVTLVVSIAMLLTSPCDISGNYRYWTFHVLHFSTLIYPVTWARSSPPVLWILRIERSRRGGDVVAAVIWLIIVKLFTVTSHVWVRRLLFRRPGTGKHA